MKLNQTICGVAGALALSAAAVAFPAQSQGQETTTTVTTTRNAGTVSAFDPAARSITMTTEKTMSPLTYHYTKETTFVDETGAPVTVEVIKSGAPVTVYYTGVGEQTKVSRVVVRKAVPVAPVIEEKTTTTTTTVEEKK